MLVKHLLECCDIIVYITKRWEMNVCIFTKDSGI